ncbi:hypothetical protein ACU686_20560 [Yinghuangia aomiensis]
MWPERPDQRAPEVIKGRTSGPRTPGVRSRRIPPHLANVYDLSRNGDSVGARAYWSRELERRLAEHYGDRAAEDEHISV